MTEACDGVARDEVARDGFARDYVARGAGVVVSGLGVVSPIGIGAPAFWRALLDGRSATDPGSATPHVAKVEGFEAREHIRSPHLRRADPLSCMMAASARMAFDDAALPADSVRLDRLGVVVGSAIGNVGESVQYLDKLFRKGPSLVSPMLFPNLVLNAPASYVAMELGAMGVNFTIADGEASGEQAIGMAFDVLASGRADVVLVAGGDDFTGDLVRQTYAHVRALAGQRGDDALCRPYDRRRSGVVLGEGAAALLLETAAHARARGARIYARLVDRIALSAPASPFGWPASTDAFAATLRDAAAKSPLPVDLVVGSANGSWVRDRFEIELVARLLEGDRRIWLTAIKGAIGEFGGGGMLAAVATCLAIRDGQVPPVCHLREADTSAALNFAAGVSVAAPVRAALTLGLARGGSGMALRFEHPEVAA